MLLEKRYLYGVSFFVNFKFLIFPYYICNTYNGRKQNNDFLYNSSVSLLGLFRSRRVRHLALTKYCVI